MTIPTERGDVIGDRKFESEGLSNSAYPFDIQWFYLRLIFCRPSLDASFFAFQKRMYKIMNTMLLGLRYGYTLHLFNCVCSIVSFANICGRESSTIWKTCSENLTTSQPVATNLIFVARFLVTRPTFHLSNQRGWFVQVKFFFFIWH